MGTAGPVWDRARPLTTDSSREELHMATPEITGGRT